MSKLNLTADEVLSTTRAVRKRLDFDREVPMDVIEECLQLAMQAPSGSNAQGWHFVVVTDREKIAAIATLYQEAFAEYIASDYRPDKQHTDNPDMAATQKKVQSSAQYLSDNLSKVPALLIPCSDMRPDIPGLPLSAIAGITGSLIPAVWSFMLAARERGIGTCWTTLHLEHEKAVAELLDIPDSCAQIALIPIAYTLGTDFKIAQRKPLDGVLHHNSW